MKLLYCRQHSLLVHALGPTAALHDGRRGARARLLLLATLIFFLSPSFFFKYGKPKIMILNFLWISRVICISTRRRLHHMNMKWHDLKKYGYDVDSLSMTVLRLEQILEEHSAGEHLSLPQHEVMSSPVKRGVQMVEGAYEIIIKNEEEELYALRDVPIRFFPYRY